jgi:hypothetical protein
VPDQTVLADARETAVEEEVLCAEHGERAERSPREQYQRAALS